MPILKRTQKTAPNRPFEQPAYPKSFILSALLISFAAFSPGLVFNKAYFASDLLQYFIHARSMLRTQILEGHFPLWSPYSFGGQPFFANPNMMMCDPLNYPTLLFPIPYGLALFYLLHMFLACLGMYFWLKNLDLSKNACHMGAFIFSLSGYFWWHLIDPNLIAVYSCFPWFLGCLEKIRQKWEAQWAFLSGLCFALIFCCGNFQSASCVFYTGLAYLLFLMISASRPAAGKELHPSLSWPKLARLLFFALWGAFPLLVQLIPPYEFYKLSYRNNPILNYDNFNATFSMDPRSIYQFLFPSLGVPPGTKLEDAIQAFNLQDPFKDNGFLGVYGYLGVWAPLLMFMAFRQKGGKKTLFMAGLGLLGLLTAWGHHFPLHRLECLILPGINLSRAPYRFIMTYVLFASALCAYGYQSLERLCGKGRRFPLMLGIYFYSFCLLLPCFFRPSQAWREILGLILGTGGILLWDLTDRFKKQGQWIFMVSLILPILLSGWSGFGWGPFSNYDLEGNFPAFTYLKEKAPEGRYFFDSNLTYPALENGQVRFLPFPQNAAMGLKIRSIGGHDAFFLQKTYDLVSKLPSNTFTRLFALKGEVLKNSMGEIKGVLHHSFPGAEVYEPIAPPPFLNAPYLLRVAGDEPEALQLIRSPGFDPAQDVVLSEPLPPSITSRLPHRPATLAYSLEKENTDDQVFKVRLDKDSLVVFSEIMYPGWKAWIDGEKAPIFTGDYTFRTLFIPAGEHAIEFRFEPAWAKPLLFGLLLWLASVLGYGLFKGWTRGAPPPKMDHA